MFVRTHLVYSLDPPLMYPGLAVRVAAFVIDFVVLLALDVAAVAFIAFPVGLIRGIDVQGLALIELTLWIAMRWLYFALWESSPYCATPGAMACHMKVVDAGDGEPPTFSQASIRLGAKLVSVVLLFAGWLPVFFEARRRALHDILSGCVVIRFEPQVVVDAALEAFPDEAERLSRVARPAEDAGAAAAGGGEPAAPAARTAPPPLPPPAPLPVPPQPVPAARAPAAPKFSDRARAGAGEGTASKAAKSRGVPAGRSREGASSKPAARAAAVARSADASKVAGAPGGSERHADTSRPGARTGGAAAAALKRGARRRSGGGPPSSV